jgi:5-hydroxyisourate hydrolase
MPGLSIHTVDVSRGIVATGLEVGVDQVAADGTRLRLAGGRIGGTGVLDAPALSQPLEAGVYEATFHVGAYFRDAAIALPPIPFLDVVVYRFGIADPRQHYHLPFKFTPWGYSCFRGGA